MQDNCKKCILREEIFIIFFFCSLKLQNHILLVQNVCVSIFSKVILWMITFKHVIVDGTELKLCDTTLAKNSNFEW